MRVYHFVKRDYGLSNLVHRRLKVATIEDLNDPFELLSFSTPDPGGRHAIRRNKEQLAANNGVLCFSKHWHNPVQWSHYADGHQGICLGFDVPDRNLAEVNYVSKREHFDPILLDGPLTTAQAHMLRMLTTKFAHWRYENETRVFVRLDHKTRDKNGLYFVSFSRKLVLREVIVGHRSTVTRQELAEALGANAQKVATFKARLAFRSFRVVRQRKQSLWE